MISLLLPIAAAGAAAERLNVLLMVADDLTACLGAYGNTTCRTPNLDRLAAESVLFERAYCQQPVCGPSRASFMSGLYPATTRMTGKAPGLNEPGSYKLSNPELATHPSIGELLRRNGYFSARVSKIFHLGIPGGIESGSSGGDEPASWDHAYNVRALEAGSPGRRELLSPKRTQAGNSFTRVVVPDTEAGNQADVIAVHEAIRILDERAGRSEPFFLAVGFVRPHVPFVVPQRWHDAYPAGRMEVPVSPPDDLADVPPPARRMANPDQYGMSQAQKREAISGYYASVSFMDEQVGRLLGALERLQLRGRTIVLFTSDHGYNLGEHDCWQKNSLFEESVRVPLLISAPGFERSAGRRTAALVELVDLYPTIADLTGAAGTPAMMQGLSLRPLLEAPARTDWGKDAAYTVTYESGESIRTPRWRYNRWGEVGEELYDHINDPQEFTNLAGRATHQGQIARMRTLLEQARARASGR